MVPPIISDTFEALENLAGQTVKSAVQVPKKIVEQGKKQLGLGAIDKTDKGIEGGTVGQTKSGADPTQVKNQQIQRMEQVAKQKANQRYKEIQQQILAISHQKQQEVPEEMKGKPGYSEEKMIRQLEEEKKPEAQRKAEQAAKEPIPLQRERRKAEMHRGASG